jgi:hypothetical protein
MSYKTFAFFNRTVVISYNSLHGKIRLTICLCKLRYGCRHLHFRDVGPLNGWQGGGGPYGVRSFGKMSSDKVFRHKGVIGEA